MAAGLTMTPARVILYKLAPNGGQPAIKSGTIIPRNDATHQPHKPHTPGVDALPTLRMANHQRAHYSLAPLRDNTAPLNMAKS